MRDLYRILGIPDNATMADIKSAYRRLAKQYHPDLNPGSRNSEEKFKEILDAYTILSDDELRAQYDRKRRLGSSGPFKPQYSSAEETDKQKDPRRREYPPEYIEKMRQRHRKRIVEQIKRRKKILYGMIISFAFFLLGAAYFEYWIHLRNIESNRALATWTFVAENSGKKDVKKSGPMEDMESPFDAVFGPEVTSDYSPNQIVIVNPYSDAIICLTQADSPYVTLNNNFVHARSYFFMKHLPNGKFLVKVYTGSDWDRNKAIPGGQHLGGFTSHEKFFIIKHDPIVLTKPTYEHPNTVSSDTLRIDTSGAQIREISPEEFFGTSAQ